MKKSGFSKSIFSIAALLLIASSNVISYAGSLWFFGEPDMPESLLK